MNALVSKRRGLKATVLAVVCSVALTGCAKLPFDLPDLPNIPDPFTMLDNTSSVDEARDAQLAATEIQLQPGDLVADGILTVGIKNKEISAPFVITSSDGSLYGIDIDVASAMADKLGLRVRFVSVDEVDNPLTEGVCDIVMDASPNRVNYSTVVGGYYESAVAFFAKGDRRVVSVDELNGKSVGVQDGSVSQGVLGRTSLSMNQTTFANLNEAFEALEAGNVDYVLCDAYSGAYLAAAYEGINFAGALSSPSSQGIAVAQGKSNLEVATQNALGAVMSDGSMDIIRSTWIGGMPSLTPEDIIANIPDMETVDPGGEDIKDGSTAGANAIVL